MSLLGVSPHLKTCVVEDSIKYYLSNQDDYSTQFIHDLACRYIKLFVYITVHLYCVFTDVGMTAYYSEGTSYLLPPACPSSAVQHPPSFA